MLNIFPIFVSPTSVPSLDLGPDFEICPGLKDIEKQTPKKQAEIREFYSFLFNEEKPTSLAERLKLYPFEPFSNQNQPATGSHEGGKKSLVRKIFHRGKERF